MPTPHSSAWSDRDPGPGGGRGVRGDRQRQEGRRIRGEGGAIPHSTLTYGPDISPSLGRGHITMT